MHLLHESHICDIVCFFFCSENICFQRNTSNCDLALMMAACRTLEMTVAVLCCNLVLQQIPPNRPNNMSVYYVVTIVLLTFIMFFFIYRVMWLSNTEPNRIA